MLYYIANTIILLVFLSQNASIFKGFQRHGDMFTFLINSYFVHKYIVVLLYSQPEKLKSNSQKNKIHNHIKFQKKYSYFYKKLFDIPLRTNPNKILMKLIICSITKTS